MRDRYSVFVLVRVKFLKKNDLWLFIIGILLVSIIGATVSSFSLGITNEEFYFGEEDDVLIITQPGASTPLTSRVPYYIEKDLETINGISNISAETLSLCILSNYKNTVVTVRGVTNDYADISFVNIKSGKWLYNDENSNISSFVGVVVGYSLAKQLDLSINDHLLLSSSMTDIFLELIVEGIHEQTWTPIDEELFVKLENGQALSALSDTEVTFLRVKYQESIITENEINYLLKSIFTLKISMYSAFWDFQGDINDYNFKIFSYTREFLEEDHFNSFLEEISFELPFGRYIAVIENQKQNTLIEKTIVLDRNRTVIFNLDEVLNSIKVFTQYNGIPLPNIEITLHDDFFNKNYKSNTDENGQTTLIYSENRVYSLSGVYNGVERYSRLIGNEENITFDFLNILTFEIKNATNGNPIEGAEVIISESYNQTLYSNNYGKIVCNITESSGMINVQSGNFTWNNLVDFGLTSRRTTAYNLSLATVWLGLTNLMINTYDFNDSTLQGANVTIIHLITNEIFQGLTNESGIIFFSDLKANNLYEIQTTFENSTKHQIISLEHLNVLNIRFNTESIDLEFTIKTINGISLEIIEGARITIYETISNYLLFNSTSNSDGELKIITNDFYQARIEVTFDSFIFESFITIYPYGYLIIPLGDVKVITSVYNHYKDPLSEVSVTITYYDGIQNSIQGFTNSTGYIEFTIPISDFTINISYSDRNFEYNYKVDRSRKMTNNYYIDIGKNFRISLRDKNNVEVSEAFITIDYEINSTHYLRILSGITDDKGNLDIESILEGKYLIKIEIIDVLFYSEIEVLPNENEVIISVNMDFNQLKDFKLNKWPGRRVYQVSTSNEYVDTFIDTSLSIITLSVLSIVIIVTALSSLSLRSVVTFTIERYSNQTIPLLRRLGATRKQIALNFAIQFSIISVFTSILGILFGYYLVTEISQIKVTNIAGILIYPVLDYFFSSVIVLTVTTIVFLTTFYHILRIED